MPRALRAIDGAVVLANLILRLLLGGCLWALFGVAHRYLLSV
jgi:hypothetical protein